MVVIFIYEVDGINNLIINVVLWFVGRCSELVDDL